VLPPDPRARRQAGLSREYTTEEAFTLLLTGYLISNLPLTIAEVKEILADLDGWFKDNNLLINASDYSKNMTIYIIRAEFGSNRPTEFKLFEPCFCYEWKQHVEKPIEDEEGITTERYKRGHILNKPDAIVYMYQDNYTRYIFPISNLIAAFRCIIFDDKTGLPTMGPGVDFISYNMLESVRWWIFGHRRQNEE
jgi:hypothetical protein